MLTARRLMDLAMWTLHSQGGVTPNPVEPLFIVNQSMQHVCGMHAWQWLSNRVESLDFHQGAETIPVPDECAAVLEVYSTSTSRCFEPKSLDEVERMRSISTGSQTRFWYAVASNAEGRMELALWPPPSASTPNAARLRFRAHWVELVDEEARIPIPPFMESLAIAVTAEFARGLVKESERALHFRLDDVKRTSVFSDAQGIDGTQQQNFGALGPVDAPAPLYPANYLENPVLPPS